MLLPSAPCASRTHVAVNLRAARALFYWSQAKLGEECGLKRSYIGALERAEVSIGIDNLDRLASGIGVSAHVLLMSPEHAYEHLFDALGKRKFLPVQPDVDGRQPPSRAHERPSWSGE